MALGPASVTCDRFSIEEWSSIVMPAREFKSLRSREGRVLVRGRRISVDRIQLLYTSHTTALEPSRVIRIFTDRISVGDNAIASVRMSARPSVCSTLSSESTDR